MSRNTSWKGEESCCSGSNRVDTWSDMPPYPYLAPAPANFTVHGANALAIYTEYETGEPASRENYEASAPASPTDHEPRVPAGFTILGYLLLPDFHLNVCSRQSYRALRACTRHIYSFRGVYSHQSYKILSECTRQVCNFWSVCSRQSYNT